VVWAACCLALAGLALAGCREEECIRILAYNKGVYLGKPDQPLDQAQIEALRYRANDQKF
jgi:hypothetical protein